MQLQKPAVPFSMFTMSNPHWHKVTLKWKFSLQVSFIGELSHGGRGECQLAAVPSLPCEAALPISPACTKVRHVLPLLVLTVVRHRRWKITARSFCNSKVVQPGASVCGFLCVAWKGEVYCNRIQQPRRAGVCLVQFSAAAGSLPVENL